MLKIDVLTVSRRTGWEDIAQASLNSQTYRSFSWKIVSENDLKVPYVKSPTPTRKSNLNASLNLGLKQCTGDYVIFYQDFIKLQPDCFEKLIDLVDDSTFVTTLTKNPPGVEDDPRGKTGLVRECPPEEWEANVSIAPLDVIRYLGGFDEEYDEGWSWDNCNLAVRASMLGCKFLIDETNNPQLLPHDKNSISKENGEFHAWRILQIQRGEFPLRLDYLK